MSKQTSFSPKQWLSLQFAPLWVFLAVAGADGAIDKRELKALLLELDEAHLYRDPLTNEILSSLRADFENLMFRFGEETRDVRSSLIQVANILDEAVTATEAHNFKKALFLIGQKVADASGTGAWGPHRKINEREKKVLDQIATVLGQSLTVNKPVAIKHEAGSLRRIFRIVTSTMFLSIASIVLFITALVSGGWFLSLDPGTTLETISALITLTSCGLGILALIGTAAMPTLGIGINSLSRGLKVGGAVSLIFLVCAPFLCIWIFTQVLSREIAADNIEEISAGTIELGEQVPGIAEPNTRHGWTFEGKPDQIVTVEMEAKDETLNPKLTLVGPFDNTLAESPEVVSGTVTMLIVYLPEAGSYTIFAQGTSGTEGEYSLSLNQGLSQQINIGETKHVDPAENYVWHFSGHSGQIINVELTFNDLFTLNTHRLTLRGPQDAEVIDQAEGTATTQLNNVVLTQDATYTVTIVSTGGTAGYTLSLTEVIPKIIEMDDSNVGNISDNTVWAFDGTVGQIINIELMKGTDINVDPSITVKGPDGRIIRSDNDSGDGNNALISNLILKQNGRYLAIPEAFSFTDGVYQISISEGQIDMDDPEAADLFIERGRAYARQTDYQKALADYEKAAADFQQAIALDDENPSYYNSSCWFGSSLGDAANVLKDCERAVELAETQGSSKIGAYRDSRGLARALTNNIAGAIEDFEFYVEYGVFDSTDRREWIDALENGENPFTEELLDDLRNE